MAIKKSRNVILTSIVLFILISTFEVFFGVRAFGATKVKVGIHEERY